MHRPCLLGPQLSKNVTSPVAAVVHSIVHTLAETKSAPRCGQLPTLWLCSCTSPESQVYMFSVATKTCGQAVFTRGMLRRLHQGDIPRGKALRYVLCSNSLFLSMVPPCTRSIF